MSKEDVSVACTSCSRHHLTTSAGVLSEAARLAKNRDMSDPEIQDRISIAENEINAMERVDLSPEKLSLLPPEEREITRKMLNDVRTKIRHKLDMGIRWGQGSISDLEDIARDASVINANYLRDITPYHLKDIEKNVGRISTGQTGGSDNTWVWWIVTGAVAGFIGWLLFKKKEEEI